MFRLKFAAAALCSLFLSGCATMVQLQIKRAPEINLAGAKSVKIEPFRVDGRLMFDDGRAHGSVLGAVLGLALGSGASKADESRYSGIQFAVLSGYKQKVFADGFYQLREGSEYDALVTGTITYDVTDSGDVRAYKDREGNVFETYELTRKASVRVAFTVTGKNGVVLGSSEVSGYAERTSSDPDRNKARHRAVVWDELVKEALLQTEEPFLRKIAPYFVTESRTFENGDSEFVKEGNKAAGKGNWVIAAEQWKQAQASGSPEDRVAAVYNLGIYDEVESRLPEALSKFQEAKRLSGNSKFEADIDRIQGRITEDQKLRAISGAAPAPTPSSAPAPAPSSAPAAAPVAAASGEPPAPVHRSGYAVTGATPAAAASAPVPAPVSDEALQAWIATPSLKVVREKSLHRFNWEPLPEAAGYHVFTAKKAGKPFKQLNHNLLVKPQLRAPALPRGKMLVRVVALDPDGNEIAKSKPMLMSMP